MIGRCAQRFKDKTLRLITLLQLLVASVGVLVLLKVGQTVQAISVAAGVSLMMVNGWLLFARVEKSCELDVGAGQKLLYIGAVARFIMLIAALLIAQRAGLHLLWLAAGMFAAQAVVFVVALQRTRAELGAKN